MWTYDTRLLSDPTSGPMMQVRLLVGDTNEDDQQLQDEEITFFIASETTLYTAAARAAHSLSAFYARKANKKVGDLSLQQENISKHYAELAERLDAKGKMYQIPTAGGIEVAERDANQSDDSVTHNAVRRGMHDFVKPPVRPNTQ